MDEEEYKKIDRINFQSSEQNDWDAKKYTKVVSIKEIAGGIIKSCRDNTVGNYGHNFVVFPDDGGKPYGSFIEVLLTFTNELELKLEFEQDSNTNCLAKLRSGEVDLMVALSIKDDREQWLDFVYVENSLGGINIGISKKSKYSTRVVNVFNEIAKEYGPNGKDHFLTIYKSGGLYGEDRNYENSFDHTWYGNEKEEIQISYNCKKEVDEKKDDDDLDLIEMADDSSDKEVCDKLKLSEITTYIDKEFFFSLYMNQMSEIVKSKNNLTDGTEGKYYHLYGPIFFNISSPIDSVLLTGNDHRFLKHMTNIGSNMNKYWKHSKKLENNINYCLENPSACVYFDESVVTYLIMKNSYNIDFAKNDSVCNSGLKQIVVYSKDKKGGVFDTKPYQRISFKGSCFDRNPPHYFFGRQDPGFKTTPFLENTYKYLIQDLAKYHYVKVWDIQNADPKSILSSVKRNIKESKKILNNDKEWKSVTSFLNQYGKLMKNSIKTRKQVVDELRSKKKRQEEQKISDLKNKVRTPVNLEEALVYFNVKYGGVPVFSTPYNPDGKVYGVHGTIKGMIGGYYRINMENIVVGKRNFLLNTSDTLSEGQYVQIVGTFNEVEMLSTLFSDIEKPYAVFSDIKYLNGRLK